MPFNTQLKNEDLSTEKNRADYDKRFQAAFITEFNDFLMLNHSS